MKNRVISLLVLVPALTLSMGSVQAQEKKAAKPVAAKTTAAKKAPAKKAPAKRASTAKKGAAVAAGAGAAAAAASIPAQQTLTPAELAIAEQVYQGRISCELGASINIAKDSVNPGYFFVEGKGFKYHMAPVATSTGTIRLEDQHAGAMWLQVANKSMLINRKLGQRLADECMSPEQNQVAEAIKKNPPAALFEGNGR
ncbi:MULTISPECIES: hypothetical protein [Comamonas]|uniref:Uncharacterized protein n=1 Tax=Comamonas squillarum TaxID=2977320 RepID=A0ABY5ZXI4_9BURK|nr:MULTISPECIES: hypothetical protein [Comamonas]PWB19477.1 hypothetical protein DCO45_05770 [Comamonas sp. JNW]UXC18613.1 hypothetical protein N4T19_00260 [Comamonas sp. PR12]